MHFWQITDDMHLTGRANRTLTGQSSLFCFFSHPHTSVWTHRAQSIDRFLYNWERKFDLTSTRSLLYQREEMCTLLKRGFSLPFDQAYPNVFFLDDSNRMLNKRNRLRKWMNTAFGWQTDIEGERSLKKSRRMIELECSFSAGMRVWCYCCCSSVFLGENARIYFLLRLLELSKWKKRSNGQPTVFSSSNHIGIEREGRIYSRLIEDGLRSEKRKPGRREVLLCWRTILIGSSMLRQTLTFFRFLFSSPFASHHPPSKLIQYRPCWKSSSPIISCASSDEHYARTDD